MLVDSAAMCEAAWPSPSVSASQPFTRWALAIVSCVVKVLLATSTRVRAGSRVESSARQPCPSTLPRCSAAIGEAGLISARTAITGPRSLPPMPMFRMWVKRWPVAPRSAPPCTAWVKACMRLSVEWISAATAAPPEPRVAPAGARNAMCSARRCSVMLTSSPAAMASRRTATPVTRASSCNAAMARSSIAVLLRSSSKLSARKEKRSNRAGSAANRVRMPRGSLPSARGKRPASSTASHASVTSSMIRPTALRAGPLPPPRAARRQSAWPPPPHPPGSARRVAPAVRPAIPACDHSASGLTTHRRCAGCR